MAEDIRADDLVGHWIQGDTQEGKLTFEYHPGAGGLRHSVWILQSDGRWEHQEPGPADGVLRQTGRWSLDGRILIVTNSESHAYRIESVEAGRSLVIVRE